MAVLALLAIFLLQWKMRWSLTYVATPIAVAVRQVLLPVVVLPIRQVDVYSRHFSVQHRYVSAFQVAPCILCWNALAPAGPFDLGSLCVCAVVVLPVSPGSWPGGAWVPWRALPFSCCVFVASGDPGP